LTPDDGPDETPDETPSETPEPTSVLPTGQSASHSSDEVPAVDAVDSVDPVDPPAFPVPLPPIVLSPDPLDDSPADPPPAPPTEAGPAILPEAMIDKRAQVQKQLRKERKKAERRKHRWRRRVLYLMSFIIFIGVAGAGGIFFYARYRYDEIPKKHLKHLVKQAAAPGKPFNVLLVGSDSRAFVDNPTQVKAFGDAGDAGGQRSDVTMVARFVPATKSVTVISIPRDLWVDIPPNSSDIQGMNRINAADNAGPDLLIQTIETDLHIPINHYMSVGFPGFSGMVDALGGVTMDFPTEVKDAYTGLDVTTVGCQLINGTTSLQLVRSRHLEYMNSKGHWEYDGLSDFSRIQRQDSFFRAVLAKVNTSITNPLAVNNFISSAVGNLAIDDTLSEGDLYHIATEFRGLASSNLVTETLPTTSYVTGGGADVLLPAQPYDTQMIAAFNQLGNPTPNPATTTTTTAPPLKNSAVSVNVLNASGGGLLATDTSKALRDDGFVITGVNNAPTTIAAGDPSEIFYGPTGLPAAHTLAASLKGKVTYVPQPSLTGDDVTLWVASATLTVTTTTTSTTTTTAVPGSPTTTTTIPGNVYTNTQPEAWNPVPCTLGAPTTTTTVKQVATKQTAKKPAPSKSSG
jgi:LCP family protein required for cell wall assembly